MNRTCLSWNNIFLSINSNSSEISDAIKIIFSALISSNDFDYKNQFNIIAKNDVYIMYLNNKNMRIEGRYKAINILVSEIINFFTISGENCIFLHGGAIHKNGQTSIFLGRSKSGKTSLISALVMKYGYAFFSDEVLVIDATSHCIIPFQRALGLREETIQYLGLMKSDLFSIETLDNEKVYYISHESISSNKCVQSYNINNIIFPMFFNDNKIVNCDKSEAFKFIISNSVNMMSKMKCMIDHLILLLQITKQYKLMFTDLNNGIKQFLEIEHEDFTN